jgi:aspartyl aminopeptidase
MKYQPKNGWETAAAADKEKIEGFCEGYKDFLNQGKTERECVAYAIREAEKRGYRPLKDCESLKAGDKVYADNRGKGLLLAVIGQNDIREGFQIVVSHIDSPRVDLKQNPLYEDTELALLKTHYYGGIKKYQWTTIPLALHGVVVKNDGTAMNIVIGEDEGDPVFCITDLLPHLADEQMSKPMKEAIKGEGLNILVGSKPNGDEKDGVKGTVLTLLHERYGMCEEDFLSAELEAVPAGKARDVGFDRSMVGGYGQDDRVCAYAALSAIFGVDAPAKTSICVWADKEEVGSMGNTGMKSRFFEDTAALLASKMNAGYNDLTIRAAFAASQCLSADVGVATDPTYKDVQESRNAPKMNYGVLITKYTGSRGKAGSSDASAEFMGAVRALCNDNEIVWQVGELGSVDKGGGGTVAQFVANLNIDTIDAGVPVLSMHSPLEVTGKLDIYMAYKTYHAFMK